MTTETPEALQKLVSDMSSELVNAKARIRELESITTCKLDEIEKLPTPETDEHMEGGSYSFDCDFARNLERHRDFLSARIIERTVAFEKKDRERCDVNRELKRELDEAKAQVAKWKQNFIPFAIVHASQYGKDHYSQEGCLHFTHYDMLEEAGARMVDFKRCGES